MEAPSIPEPVLNEEEQAGFRKGVDEFNRGLYFECHDTLEELWSGIRGPGRDFFQGLIQVAVGFQHLANRNLEGARALLRDGATKLAGRRLEGQALSRFAEEVAGCLGEIVTLGADAIARFDWSRVPRFPAGG